MISRAVAAPAARAHDARMLTVADGLFDEFDVPVIMVVRALSSARRELHEAGIVPAPPELIGARARGLLLYTKRADAAHPMRVMESWR